MSFLVLVFILFCCWLILALSKGDICELLHFHNFFTFKGDTCEAFSQKTMFSFFGSLLECLDTVASGCVACSAALLLRSSVTATAVCCPREAGRDDSTED